MLSSEVVEFYEKRLETILKEHAKKILNDNDLDIKDKKMLMDNIERMLISCKPKVYTDEEMNRIEKEDMGR